MVREGGAGPLPRGKARNRTGSLPVTCAACHLVPEKISFCSVTIFHRLSRSDKAIANPTDHRNFRVDLVAKRKCNAGNRGERQMANERKRLPVRQHRPGSIPAVAAAAKISEQMLRRAVDRGEVEAVSVGGLRRILPREQERLKELFPTD
jgi:hypothetical protein